MKEYKHLNLAQRSVISALKASGMKQKKLLFMQSVVPALYTCKKKVEDKKSIEERPEIVSQKTEFRHWEIDLIVGVGNKGAILTL